MYIARITFKNSKRILKTESTRPIKLGSGITTLYDVLSEKFVKFDPGNVDKITNVYKKD